MKSFPRSRVTGESVREAVAHTILTEITDPRLALITVTSAQVSPDLRHADIYVIAHGDEARYREVLDGLSSANGRIRRCLGQQVRMKFVPELHFRIDPSVDEAEKIEALIREESGRLAQDTGDTEGTAGETTSDE